MAQPVLDSKLRTFEDFFSPESLASIFEKRVRGESGSGRDHLSPDRFVELYPQGFDIISKQCLSNSYVFGPYKEVLCLKGRGKTPRVLSIPTVRDKIVLSALTEFMQENFPQCVEHRTPNAFIRKIKDFCKNTTCGLKFFKTDIVGFFENIDHDLLLQKIEEVISDERVLSLVRASINTPTLASGDKLSTKPNLKGVPQGLPLSNILAEIYMQECDVEFKKLASFYCRYVDDILFIGVEKPYISRIISKYFNEHLSGLKLSKTKSHMGYIGKDEITYIGYTLTDKGVSVKAATLERMMHSIAEICRRIRHEEIESDFRPSYIKSDEDFYAFYQELLNEKISGLRYHGRLYGWMPYYMEITDKSVLYRMDNILKKILKRYVKNVDRLQINSFVASYYAVKQKGRGDLIHDFDRLNSSAEKAAFLKRKGKIGKRDYSDGEIERLYDRYCRGRIRTELNNIGDNS